jgi:hypothetical protein
MFTTITASHSEVVALRKAIEDICDVLEAEPNWQDAPRESQPFTERDIPTLLSLGFKPSPSGSGWTAKINGVGWYVDVNSTPYPCWYYTTATKFNVKYGTMDYDDVANGLENVP